MPPTKTPQTKIPMSGMLPDKMPMPNANGYNSIMKGSFIKIGKL